MPLSSELIVGCLERGCLDSAHNSHPVTAARQAVQVTRPSRLAGTLAAELRRRHAGIKIAKPPSVVDTAAGQVNGRSPPATYA